LINLLLKNKLMEVTAFPPATMGPPATTVPVITGPCMDNLEWKDAFDDGCEWYEDKPCDTYYDNYNNGEIDGLLENCPVTCGLCEAAGDGDPHFSGFHNEKMDLIHDPESSNRWLNLFCTEDVSVNVLLSETPSGLLFMTKTAISFAGAEVAINAVADDDFSFVLNDDTLALPNGESLVHPEVSISRNAKMLVVKLSNTLQVNVKVDLYDDAQIEGIPYLYVSFSATASEFPTVSGLLGQTLHKEISDEEFKLFRRFVLPVGADEMSCNVWELL